MVRILILLGTILTLLLGRPHIYVFLP
uniref:Uncharacterized protein n=1 Tax=Arundo donax TaxID=35708 RepID=A0A0A8ZQR1_ARUDO